MLRCAAPQDEVLDLVFWVGQVLGMVTGLAYGFAGLTGAYAIIG